jgi:hypothetical protein
MLLLLSGCDSWPPYEKEIKEHFNSHKSDIELLREKLLDSKYLSVGESMGVVVWGHFYVGELVDGTIVQNEQPMDEAEWLKIFQRSEIDGVGRKNYDHTAVSISKVSFRGNLKKNIDWTISYVHDRDLPNQVRQCGNEDPNVRCGSCITELGDSWYLQYWWSPFPNLTEAEEARLNGTISEQEYYELSFQAMDACYAEGGMLLTNDSGS